MIEVNVSSPIALCKALIQAGRQLEVGQAVVVNLSGVYTGQIKVVRGAQDILVCDGTLFGFPNKGKISQQIHLYGNAGAFQGPTSKDPETILTRNGEGREATVADLYEGGARFSPSACPMAKMGKPATPAGLDLVRKADKSLRKWVSSLPEGTDLKGLLPKKSKVRQEEAA